MEPNSLGGELIDLVVLTASTFFHTILDVLPIVGILLGFQLLFLKKRPPNPGKMAIGFLYVLAGLTLFLVGLEKALFPLGETMASQLTAPEFLYGGLSEAEVIAKKALKEINWQDYMWVYVFAAAIGFATTIAEPSLIAVSIKAEEISGGAISEMGLRLAVAVGVAAGVSIGAYRIVSGTPLPWYIMAGYAVVILQTLKSSKMIIPLAYDSGGVTTSTVTVPVVAALGLGLASTIPGRSPLIDGFGLIAFASVFPIMTVLGYAMAVDALRARSKKSRAGQTPAQDKGEEKP
ncbi:MAG: DUF1538 domain-containing protein [Magnetovibrionaceae bacterium]